MTGTPGGPGLLATLSFCADTPSPAADPFKSPGRAGAAAVRRRSDRGLPGTRAMDAGAAVVTMARKLGADLTAAEAKSRRVGAGARRLQSNGSAHDHAQRARHAGGDHPAGSDGGQHRPGAAPPRPARPRQPAAHQDPQDPGDRENAGGRGRGRHHLPEGGRGRGVRRRRRVRRHSPDLQHHRRGQDRAADGADQADRAPGRGPGQRGGRARPVAGRGPARRGRPISGRVRHRLRAQRRADAGRRPGARPPGHGPAADAVRRPDDLPEQGAGHGRVPRARAAAVQGRRDPRSPWCPAAAPRRSRASASSR